MSFGFGNIFNILARQAGQNQSVLLQFNQQQSSGVFNERGLGIASSLFQAVDRVSISTPGISLGGVTSSIIPSIPQGIFSDIAAEISSTESLVNNLDPGAVDEDLSQVVFLFQFAGSLAEIQQASHNGSTVTNEFNGSGGISSFNLRTRADNVFDDLVKDGQALELAINNISDTTLRDQLLDIQDDIAALLTRNNAADADEAVSLVADALALLPESTNNFFDQFDTTTLSQTSENLLEFGSGVSRALADFAQAELNQGSPDSALLSEVNSLFETLNQNNGFIEDVLDGTSDPTLFASLEAERITLTGLDVNDAAELPTIRATLDTAFSTLDSVANTTAPSLIAEGNPGGIDLTGVETLLDIQAGIEQNILDIQNFIDSSGITDAGVLSALQAVVTELETIDFGGNPQDALDVLSNATDLLNTAQNTSPAPIQVTSGLVGGEPTDFGAPVRETLTNIGNSILSEGQAAAEAEALEAQLQGAVLEDIFNATVAAAERTADLLDFGSDDDDRSGFTLPDSIFGA